MKKLIVIIFLFSSLLPLSAFSDIIMNPKEARIIHLKQMPAHLYLSDPKIAKIDVINKTTLMIKANMFGETKLIALDKNGGSIRQENILVVNHSQPRQVSLYLGTQKQTYSCIKKCAPTAASK